MGTVHCGAPRGARAQKQPDSALSVQDDPAANFPTPFRRSKKHHPKSQGEQEGSTHHCPLQRDVARLKRGAQGRLVEINDRFLIVEAAGKTRRIPFSHLDRISVCEAKDLALTSGDRLQLKANAKTTDGRQLANGEIVTVKMIEPDGRIQLTDGRVLPADYRQFVLGYAVTSYAAQGKTADWVIFSDSAIKAATNQQQWYVTISRGRKGIDIFTADKHELRENVIRSGDRELANELVATAASPSETSQSQECARQTRGQLLGREHRKLAGGFVKP